MRDLDNPAARFGRLTPLRVRHMPRRRVDRAPSLDPESLAARAAATDIERCTLDRAEPESLQKRSHRPTPRSSATGNRDAASHTSPSSHP